MKIKKVIIGAIFGALFFDAVTASADQIDLEGGLLYGRVISMNPTEIIFDPGCDGNSIVLTWSDKPRVGLSGDCNAYKGWLGGDCTCGDNCVETPHDEAKSGRLFWIDSKSEQGSDAFEWNAVYAKEFEYSPENGLSFTNFIHGTKYHTNKTTLRFFTVFSYCPAWPDRGL